MRAALLRAGHCGRRTEERSYRDAHVVQMERAVWYVMAADVSLPAVVTRLGCRLAFTPVGSVVIVLDGVEVCNECRRAVEMWASKFPCVVQPPVV